MKKRYFSNPIQPLELLDIMPDMAAPTGKDLFSGKKPALLVLDMQEYFLNDSSHAFIPSAAPIIPGILELIKVFVEHGYPVIFTQHINDTLTGGLMTMWWKDYIKATSPLSALISDLPTDLGRVIPKGQYDAFFDTILENYLHQELVTDVIVTGVMTHLCCETTARSAFMRGFNTWVPADGTATYNAAFHKASLLNLSHGFAHIPTVSQILDSLK